MSLLRTFLGLAPPPPYELPFAQLAEIVPLAVARFFPQPVPHAPVDEPDFHNRQTLNYMSERDGHDPRANHGRWHHSFHEQDSTLSIKRTSAGTGSRIAFTLGESVKPASGQVMNYTALEMVLLQQGGMLKVEAFNIAGKAFDADDQMVAQALEVLQDYTEQQMCGKTFDPLRQIKAVFGDGHGGIQRSLDALTRQRVDFVVRGSQNSPKPL